MPRMAVAKKAPQTRTATSRSLPVSGGLRDSAADRSQDESGAVAVSAFVSCREATAAPQPHDGDGRAG